MWSVTEARDIRPCGVTALCVAHDVSLGAVYPDIHVTTMYPQL